MPACCVTPGHVSATWPPNRSKTCYSDGVFKTPGSRFEIDNKVKTMNRPIAILLIVLIIVGLLFSTFALFQGKFVEALLVYPLLIIAYVFSRQAKK